jgi:hypothetical protein
VKGLKPTLISAIAIGLLAGSAVGVAAQDEAADPMAPSMFTAAVTGPPEPTTDPETGLTILVAPFESTDPRVSGTWMQVEDGAMFDVADGESVSVGRNAVRLVNDGGSWVGTHRGFITFPPDGERPGVAFFSELVGEGGYEGLSMFFVQSGLAGEPQEVGVIVPSDMVPSFPEPPAE